MALIKKKRKTNPKVDASSTNAVASSVDKVATQPITKVRHMPDWVKYGFPPPEYLRFNFAGLNLSDHSIKICKCVINHEFYNLDLIDTISIPEGAVVNGELLQPDKLVKVLQKIKDTYNIDFVRLSIPEERAYLATMEIPPTFPDKLRSVVEFHIGDHIPLSVDEIQFDFDILSQHSETQKVSEVVVIAIARNIADEITGILDEAGLVPLSMEVEAQAIARAITPADSDKTYLTLDIGRSRTGLSIVKNRVVRYTTTIDFGGDDLVQKIIDLKGVDATAAEAIKREIGLDLSQYSDSEGKVLDATCQQLVDEVIKRQNFWTSQTSEEVSEILVVGGNASTPKLTNYLQEKTGKPVTIPNVWQNVFAPEHDHSPVTDGESLGYAAAIGLAINEDR
jgi:type IV pilus assembly protein PilM